MWFTLLACGVANVSSCSMTATQLQEAEGEGPAADAVRTRAMTTFDVILL